MTCPSPNVLQAYCEGRAESGVVPADIASHLQTCPECRAVVLMAASTRRTRDEAAAAQVRALRATDELAPGDAIGRFIVMHRLGEGGMGVVYAAYDPDLDRKIALKLIRRVVGEDDAGTRQLQERLMREAQAMARVTHPNVVAVHEVGRHQQHIFLAMEFVAGETLAAWLARSGRTAAEIVRVFVDAGRGLSAAHAAGLVHRDFKPNNVMVDDEGRVRVLDFGLARPAGDDESSSSPSPSRLTTPLTASGVLVGTPAYMAPEQLTRQPADAGTDQFSFCVAFYEAACGIRPFVGVDTKELHEAIVAQRLQRPSRAVPRWLLRAIERGLRADRTARWPTMQALLAELERHKPRRRGAQLAAGVLSVSLLGSLVGLVRMQRHEQRLCHDEGQKMASVWDAPHQRAVHDAFVATGLPYADDAWAGVRRTLDDYAARWTAMSTESCAATRLRGVQSEEALDLRSACLSRRRDELSSLVDAFTRADGKVVERAVQAAEALTPLDDCANVALLKLPIRPPSDPDARRKLDDLHRRLDEILALDHLGRYSQAQPLMSTLIAEARALDYAPLLAEALIEDGYLHREAEQSFKAAEASLVQAVAAAIAGHDDRALANALTTLMFIISECEGRPADAEPWELLAEAATKRLGTERALADFLSTRAMLLMNRGQFAEGFAVAKRDLALEEKIFGHESHEAAIALDGLGQVATQLGHHDEALGYFQRSNAILTRIHGSQHPIVAVSRNNIGSMLGNLGRFEEALPIFQQSLAVTRKTLGEHNRGTANALGNIGEVLEKLSRPEEALVYQRQALAIRTQALGPQHREVAVTLDDIGDCLRQLGRYDEALASYRRALAIDEPALGPMHRDLGPTLDGIGRTLTALHRYDEAMVVFRRELALLEKALPATHPALAAPLTGMGEVLLAQHAAATAIAPLERALGLREKDAGNVREIVETRFLLAQALWQSGRDRARARSLAQQAADGTARARDSDLTRRIERWLRDHP